MAQFRTTESLPPVVKNLIIANVFVFIIQFLFESKGVDLVEYGALYTWQSPNFRIWQLVTHMFMHGGIGHILFNMLALWMFGRYLENAWGPKRFFQFYMICGLVAGLAQMIMVDSPVGAIGASGAVMGVLAAFAYLFPNTPLYIMFIPIPVKAKWAVPGLMALDIFGAFYQQPGDNIAHWAHLGGAIAGLVLVYFWNRNNRRHFY